MGTVALMEVSDRMLKLAALIPLNRTAVTSVKLTPLMVTLVPAEPLAGEKSVIAGIGGRTSLTAVAASSMPLPHRLVLQLLPPGNGLAVFCKMISTCAGVRAGLSENISETTPVTCGVAMLVPW